MAKKKGSPRWLPFFDSEYMVRYAGLLIAECLLLRSRRTRRVTCMPLLKWPLNSPATAPAWIGVKFLVHRTSGRWPSLSGTGTEELASPSSPWGGPSLSPEVITSVKRFRSSDSCRNCRYSPYDSSQSKIPGFVQTKLPVLVDLLAFDETASSVPLMRIAISPPKFALRVT